MYSSSVGLHNNAFLPRFLLAQLHFEAIRTKKTLRKMKDALHNLPTGPKAYDDAYSEAMDRIEGHDADSRWLAKQVLLWITCAKRPLTTVELQHALAVEVDEPELDEENIPEIEDMISVCTGLVTVDEESNIIRLVHYTTQEYFKRTQKQRFPDAESDITTACLTYLSFDTFKSGFCLSHEEFDKRLHTKPLCEYAACNWGHHANASTCFSTVMAFLERSEEVEASSQVLITSGTRSSDSQAAPREFTGLHLAASFGLPAVVIDGLLQRQRNVDLVDSCGRTPLPYAAQNGHGGVVQLLLDRGAKIEAQDNNQRQALSFAAANGYEAVAQLLLDRGANIEARDRFDLTPLLWVAIRGYEAVVRLLLDRGANIEARDSFNQTPLLWATERGHEAVVWLLLDRGANIEARDSLDQTPLLQATWRGHEAVVRLLLDRGANIEARNSLDWTPLSRATRRGHKVVVRLLLDRGANIEARDSLDRTPLLRATRRGYEAVVRLLLDRGANIEARDSLDRTPLSWATRRGHEAVVWLLLDRDARNEAWHGGGRIVIT